ncbi:MAG: MBOAT family protein [Proteobacteria bacterium]|nr:MBOAT family protein [Pseudomonadota bacterium]
MLFPSFEFLLYFLPATLAGFFGLARWSRRIAALWLAMASLAFYGAWDVAFVPLLLISILGNYLAGLLLVRLRRGAFAGPALAAAVAANLAVLGYYKYSGFLAVQVLGLPPSFVAGTLLPLGISFFTFTQIAYLVDVRRGLAQEADFASYLLFVTFFPHLIAGPLLHHKQMMPQFTAPQVYSPRFADLAPGLLVFAIGLAKKVLLADSLAEYASPVFDGARDGADIRPLAAWIGAFAYAFQIYFDFSGYSDMAIGLARMFGIRMPENFASPYKAASPIEFWRRWHMTLSAFLRDYLYIPLGGNRRGPVRRYGALLATMVLGGLWHGANWTFVAWGALHGVLLAAAHLWGAARIRAGWRRADPGAVGVAATFLVVTMAWVPFRAAGWASVVTLYAAMADFAGLAADFGMPHDSVFAGLSVTTADWSLPLALLAIGGILVWSCPTTSRIGERFETLSPGARGAVAGAVLAVVPLLAAIAAARGNSEFIYFNF